MATKQTTFSVHFCLFNNLTLMCVARMYFYLCLQQLCARQWKAHTCISWKRKYPKPNIHRICCGNWLPIRIPSHAILPGSFLTKKKEINNVNIDVEAVRGWTVEPSSSSCAECRRKLIFFFFFISNSLSYTISFRSRNYHLLHSFIHRVFFLSFYIFLLIEISRIQTMHRAVLWIRP